MTLKKILMVLVPVSLLGTGFYIKNQESGKSFLVPAILENLKNKLRLYKLLIKFRDSKLLREII